MKLIRIAALITMLRDDLEDQELDNELQEELNTCLELLNSRLEKLTTHGEKSNDALIFVTQTIENSLIEIENLIK